MVPPFAMALRDPAPTVDDTQLAGSVVGFNESDAPDQAPSATGGARSEAAAEESVEATEPKDKSQVDVDLGWLDTLEIHSATAMAEVVPSEFPERAHVGSTREEAPELDAVVPPFTSSANTQDLVSAEDMSSQQDIEAPEVESSSGEEQEKPKTILTHKRLRPQSQQRSPSSIKLWRLTKPSADRARRDRGARGCLSRGANRP